MYISTTRTGAILLHRMRKLQRFGVMTPQIRKQLDNKLELRITNSGDHLLFHATDKGIEWDGIGLGQRLDRARDVCFRTPGRAQHL